MKYQYFYACQLLRKKKLISFVTAKVSEGMTYRVKPVGEPGYFVAS
jgi:hypothetical protein